MSNDRRPFIGKIWIEDWRNIHTGKVTPGIKLGGASGIAAHLTKSEAYALANEIVDLADQLPDPTPPKAPIPCYGTNSALLTAADGTPEPDLPATIAA
ncbi:hypothetical protein M2368_001417 [Arthrobacter sp. JUb119]|nr:hypothetical protein [Arthrobacter sp. JUb119]